MRPLIGIISRDYYSESNKKINIFYKDIVSSVIKSGGLPVGIPYDEDISLYTDLCDGFILQGGDDISKLNLKNIKILKKKDIPLLGICLGMQEMFYDNNITLVSEHKINRMHEINIVNDSLLYKILKKDKIKVNSRHKSAIRNTKYQVGAYSSDNVIESIEDRSKKFFLGFQWHPENMYWIDSNSRKIFDYFVNICKNK